MKKIVLCVFCFASSLPVATRADQNLPGNVTVTGGASTGNLNVTGAIDSDSNAFTFGTQGTSFGGSLLYQDSNIDTFTFGINRTPASWLWQHNSAIKAMRLDSSHQLLLFNADGTTAGVTLTPASNQLSLGTATLTGSGTTLTAGAAMTITGTLTAQSSFINNGPISGGSSGLTLNAGGSGNQNVTVNPTGGGYTILNGNVGIGVTIPTFKLQVAGPIASSGNLYLLGANSQIGFTRNDGVQNVGGIGWHTDGYFYLGGHPNYGVTAGSDVRVRGFGENLLLGTAGADVIGINSTGNVGIGTISADAKLQVNAGATTGLYIATANQGPWGIIMRNLSATGSGLNLYQNNAGFVSIWNNYPAGGQITLNQNDNSVGIGTSNPQAGTHLYQRTSGWPNTSGSNQAHGVLRIQPTDTGGVLDFGVNSGSGGWLQVTNTADLSQKYPLLLNPNGGDVGIGTIIPASKLHVAGSITAGSSDSTQGVDYVYGYYGSGKFFVLGSQYSSAASFLGYGVKAHPGAAGYLSSTNVSVARSSIESNMGYVAFLTGPTQTSTDGGTINLSERMRVDASGNVGIGTINPQTRLQIGSFSDGIGETTNHGSLLFSAQNTSLASTGGIEWKIASENYGAKIDTISSGGANLVFGLRNSSTTWTEAMRVNPLGNVGIGTTNPGTYKLAVKGTIHAQEIVVDNNNWADYVFDDSYRLAPLSEVEQHIKAEKHLPGIPSAQEIAAHGVSMGDMQSKLLSKIEELTLRQIAQEKQLNAQSARISQLEQENRVLRQQP